ncbi:MAG: phosphoesterase [Firmicutes bacterium]|nr:phosphoesterase [Bacillota bacterium]
MIDKTKKYRLVTRSDFDGLVCAIILKELNLIDEIKFVHPKDMQDGKIEISARDITTNLPYVEGVGMAFDHHWSELLRIGEKKDNHIIEGDSPSAARVVYNYFGGKKSFPEISDDMMIAVDKADAALFSMDDVLNPTGWELLSFLMDARTGLGRFKQFRVSNYQLMMDLIGYCKNHKIDEILTLPDVVERSEMYFEHTKLFHEQVKRCATVHDKIVVLHLKEEETIYTGNRFMVYALFPECQISIHEMWGLNKQNTVFTVGKSIFDRSSQANIGEIMLSYGGGGHANAGTCQIDNEKAEQILVELIEKLKG